MSRQLAQYLEQLAFEGERESEGSFTIDYAKALERFSRRLHADPTSYLIKFAQAAFAAGAPELQVRTHREHLEVSFAAPNWEPGTLAQLPEWLHRPLAQDMDRAQAHLLGGVHAARGAHPQTRVGIAFQDSTGGLTCVMDGESVRSQPMPPKPGAGTEMVISVRRLSPNAFKGRPQNWLPEQSALQARCALTSRPVRWDGKLLNPVAVAVDSLPARYPVLLDRIYLSRSPAQQLLGLPHLTSIPAVVYDVGGGYQDLYSTGSTLLHQWRSYKSHKLGTLLWEEVFGPDFRVLESDLMQELIGIPADGYALNHGFIRAGGIQGRGNGYHILFVSKPNVFTFTPFAVPQGRFGKRPCPCAQAWLRCPALPRGSSRLHLQVDGVLLDPLPVELPLNGAELIVADAQIKTDLSGLVPIADQRVQDIVRWFSVDLGKSKKELRKALRWNDKYGLSEDWVKQVYRIHRLDRDE